MAMLVIIIAFAVAVAVLCPTRIIEIAETTSDTSWRNVLVLSFIRRDEKLKCAAWTLARARRHKLPRRLHAPISCNSGGDSISLIL